jgi:hypothetical protein
LTPNNHIGSIADSAKTADAQVLSSRQSSEAPSSG